MQKSRRDEGDETVAAPAAPHYGPPGFENVTSIRFTSLAANVRAPQSDAAGYEATALFHSRYWGVANR